MTNILKFQLLTKMLVLMNSDRGEQFVGIFDVLRNGKRDLAHGQSRAANITRTRESEDKNIRTRTAQLKKYN